MPVPIEQKERGGFTVRIGLGSVVQTKSSRSKRNHGSAPFWFRIRSPGLSYGSGGRVKRFWAAAVMYPLESTRIQMPPYNPVAKCGEPDHVCQNLRRRRLLDCSSNLGGLFLLPPHEPSVSEDEVGSKCAGRILRATTLQPTVQLGDRGQPFALWCPA